MGFSHRKKRLAASLATSPLFLSHVSSHVTALCPLRLWPRLQTCVRLLCLPSVSPPCVRFVSSGPPCALASGLCPLVACCVASKYKILFQHCATRRVYIACLLVSLLGIHFGNQIRPLQAHPMLEKLFGVYAGIIQNSFFLVDIGQGMPSMGLDLRELPWAKDELKFSRLRLAWSSSVFASNARPFGKLMSHSSTHSSTVSKWSRDANDATSMGRGPGSFLYGPRAPKSQVIQMPPWGMPLLENGFAGYDAEESRFLFGRNSTAWAEQATSPGSREATAKGWKDRQEGRAEEVELPWSCESEATKLDHEMWTAIDV